MISNLLCSVCFKPHKARSDKFSLVLRDKNKNLSGYVCKKCSSKYIVSNRPEGLSWRKALKDIFNRKKEALNVR